jgi:hypothetical protein
MKSDGVWKHVALAFVIAVVSYFVVFAWIQHRRLFKGPWEITFVTDGTGHPSLKITQPALGVSEELDFPGQKLAQTNLDHAQQFDGADTNLPFGQMIFQDPTFLPGTMTLGMFGHQIELRRPVLIIDTNEYPWRAGATIDVR